MARLRSTCRPPKSCLSATLASHTRKWTAAASIASHLSFRPLLLSIDARHFVLSPVLLLHSIGSLVLGPDATLHVAEISNLWFLGPFFNVCACVGLIVKDVERDEQRLNGLILSRVSS